eukprot:6201973-Pleurochrysis_carterae.AAC.2
MRPGWVSDIIRNERCGDDRCAAICPCPDGATGSPTACFSVGPANRRALREDSGACGRVRTASCTPGGLGAY